MKTVFFACVHNAGRSQMACAFFNALTDCKASIYNEADSSMEASNGLNPVSSQGFAEIQSVEAKMLAKAGQIVSK